MYGGIKYFAKIVKASGKMLGMNTVME